MLVASFELAYLATTMFDAEAIALIVFIAPGMFAELADLVEGTASI